jgi:chromosomal replication initiation ATPase DnaA
MNTDAEALKALAGKLMRAACNLERRAPAVPSVSMASIMHTVAAERLVPVDAIMGPTRKRDVFKVRAEIMLRCREAGYSLGQIGRYFGGRDHTTVLSAIRRAAFFRVMAA